MNSVSSKSKTAGKVFDVTRPGRSPASPTSRPVVVEHKQVPDPLLLNDSPAADQLPAKKKVQIQDAPGAPEIAPDEFEKDLTNGPSAPDLTDKTQPAEAAPAATVADELGHTATGAENPLNDALTSELLSASSSPEPPASSTEPAPASEPETLPAATDDLVAGTEAPTVDRSQMVVSHHTRRSSLWGALGIFLLIILLGAIALDVLLDLNILKTSLNIPYTDFFAPVR